MIKQLIKKDGFYGHQGDVQFFELNELPTGCTLKPKEFIAKSEVSGHCHALCGDYTMYSVLDDGVPVTVVDVGIQGATLNHTGFESLTAEYWDNNKALPVADHRPTKLSKGIFAVGIQREKEQFSDVWKVVVD